MQKQVINRIVEGAIMSSQRLPTIFDGLTRHSPEGGASSVWRKCRAAVSARDGPGNTEVDRKRLKSVL